jgi:hypothetical protein
MAVRLSALRTSRTLLPRNIIIFVSNSNSSRIVAVAAVIVIVVIVVVATVACHVILSDYGLPKNAAVP